MPLFILAKSVQSAEYVYSVEFRSRSRLKILQNSKIIVRGSKVRFSLKNGRNSLLLKIFFANNIFNIYTEKRICKLVLREGILTNLSGFCKFLMAKTHRELTIRRQKVETLSSMLGVFVPSPYRVNRVFFFYENSFLGRYAPLFDCGQFFYFIHQTLRNLIKRPLN